MRYDTDEDEKRAISIQMKTESQSGQHLLNNENRKEED